MVYAPKCSAPCCAEYDNKIKRLSLYMSIKFPSLLASCWYLYFHFFDECDGSLLFDYVLFYSFLLVSFDWVYVICYYLVDFCTSWGEICVIWTIFLSFVWLISLFYYIYLEFTNAKMSGLHKIVYKFTKGL